MPKKVDHQHNGLLEQKIIQRNEEMHELEENERMLKCIISQSSDGIAIADENGHVIEWNPSLEEITGIDALEVLGKPYWEVHYRMLPPEQQTSEGLDQAKATIENLLQTGDAAWLGEQMVREYMHPDGSKKYIQGAVYSIETERGFMFGSSARDITEQKLAEETLMKRDTSLKEAQRIAKIGDWDVDLTTGKATLSDELYRILQIDPDTELLLAEIMDTLIHPDDRAMAEKATQEAFATGELRPFEFRIIRADGEERVLWSKGKVIKDTNGNPVRFFGINQDITERIVAERTLKENEQRYSLIAENVSDVIWVLNLSQEKPTYISPSVYQLRGYTVEEALQLKISETLTPESTQKVTQLIASRIENFKANPDEATSYIDELQQLCKNGDFVWVETSTRYQYNQKGEMEILGVSRDITLRKQAEAELAQRVNELESLHQIGIAMASRLELEELIQYNVEQTAQLMHVDACSILLVDPESDELVFQATLDPVKKLRVPPGKGIVGRALRTGTTQIVNDVQSDPDHYPEIARISGLEAHSMIASPLKMGGKDLGVLAVLNKQQGTFSQHDADLLDIIASHAATAIENASLHGQIQQHADDLEARVEERTAELNTVITAMTGREVRMADLKVVIRKLRTQIEKAGMRPVANDPLFEDP